MQSVPLMASPRTHVADKEPAPNPVGRFIRLRREKLGLSIDALSFRCHVPARQIGAYERGENQPGAELLTALLVALEIVPPWLNDEGSFTDSHIPGKLDLAGWGMPDETSGPPVQSPLVAAVS